METSDLVMVMNTKRVLSHGTAAVFRFTFAPVSVGANWECDFPWLESIEGLDDLLNDTSPVILTPPLAF